MPHKYLKDRIQKLRTRISGSPVAHRVFTGAFWSLSGAVGGKGMTLISSIVAARLMGRERYGELGIIQGTVFSFGLCAGLGLGLTATKHVAEFRDTDPERVGRILALARRVTYITGAIVAVLIFLFAGKLATKVMAAPGLALEVRIASGLLFIGALNGVQDGALYGFEAFRTIARIAFTGGVCSFVLTICGVLIAGLPGAVAATVLTSCLTWSLNNRALRVQMDKYGIPRKPPKVFGEWKTLWRFSLPAIFSGLSVVPVNWACNLILANQPRGYAEMGLLNAAIQWRNIILFVPSVMMSVALPVLANLGAVGQHQKQRKVLLTNVAIAAGIGFIAATFVSIFGKWIMASYGADFTGGKAVLVLQAFAAAIAATIGVMGQYIVGTGEMWWLIRLQVVWAFINIGLTWLFRSHGAEGLAAAYLIAYLVHFLNMGLLTAWKLNKSPKLNAPVIIPVA